MASDRGGDEPRHKFPRTRWTQVIEEAQRGSPVAFATLCSGYWYPVYAYFRRSGSPEDEARDLTQGLFVVLLEKDVAGADRTKGKFRSWLLTTARNYRADRAKWASAAIRGGKAPHLSIDADAAEARYDLEPANDLTPDRSFDRSWALGVLERALGRLRDEYEERGKAPLFDKLKSCLNGEAEHNYREMADELGMSESAFTQHVRRCKKDFRRVIDEEIAPTVSSDDEIEEERRLLYDALASR